MSQKIEFHKVRGIAEIINTTFEFTKENLKGLFKAVVLISGPFILAGSLLYGYVMYSILNMAAQSTSRVTGLPANPFFSLGMEFTLFFIVMMLALFLFYSVVYEYIHIYVNENLVTIEISDVWRAIRKDFWLLVKTVLGLILMFFIMMILFILGVIVISAIGGVLSMITSKYVIFVFVIIIYGFLFYLLIPYSLIFNVRINERRRFFNSVAQCHTLIAGNRLRTMGVVFLSLLIQFMLGFVLSIPNYIMQYLNMQSTYKMDFGWLSFVSSGLILISGFVIGTISIIAINLQYFNLVERKQAPSLLNKIEGLGATPTTTPSGNEETY